MNFNLKNIFLSLMLFIGILIFLFEPIIFGGKMFGSPDNLSPRSVGMALNNASKEIGGYPHWQPWIFGGIPTGVIFLSFKALLSRIYLQDLFPSWVNHTTPSFGICRIGAVCNCFATLSALLATLLGSVSFYGHTIHDYHGCLWTWQSIDDRCLHPLGRFIYNQIVGNTPPYQLRYSCLNFRFSIAASSCSNSVLYLANGWFLFSRYDYL